MTKLQYCNNNTKIYKRGNLYSDKMVILNFITFYIQYEYRKYKMKMTRELET